MADVARQLVIDAALQGHKPMIQSQKNEQLESLLEKEKAKKAKNEARRAEKERAKRIKKGLPAEKDEDEE